MVESGFPDFRSSFWTGVVAPAGTPPGIVAKLNAAINEGLKSAEMQASFAKLGVETRPGTPQEFAAFIASESKKWSDVANAAGIRID
jgi:tripartite-type tricarboxylate transporter receptor subunit TctC